ncbi:MAG: cytochrome c3 family protein [Maritimibacter sp.]
MTITRTFLQLAASATIALGLSFTTSPIFAQDDTNAGTENNVMTEGSDGELNAIEHALQPYVMPNTGPFRPDEIAVKNNKFIALWATSPHADASAEAFNHWNDDGEISDRCAKCHSGTGFRDFYGLDGTEQGIQGPTPVGGVVDCATCHNPGLAEITNITMPSGVSHPVSPIEAACATCHSGRESGVQVAEAIGDKPLDEVNAELRFINPHYRPAAATWLGSVAHGAFEYPGKTYSGQFFHARPIETCASCHNPHTVKVNAQVCATCHENGTPDDIRLSRVSYDGSGDTSKGIRSDLNNNAALLLTLIQDYSTEIAGTTIAFEEHYPYFFADSDQDGRADQGEKGAVSYSSWTPRLLQAAYNWKLITADPGAFVHNPHYAFEILYDSMEDLSTALGRDMADLGLYR